MLTEQKLKNMEGKSIYFLDKKVFYKDDVEHVQIYPVTRVGYFTMISPVFINETFTVKNITIGRRTKKSYQSEKGEVTEKLLHSVKEQWLPLPLVLDHLKVTHTLTYKNPSESKMKSLDVVDAIKKAVGWRRLLESLDINPERNYTPIQLMAMGVDSKHIPLHYFKG